MTRSRYGMLAGIAGAAFAWWFRKRRSGRSESEMAAERGETIYSNTPMVP